jgi:hypothetical protein
MPRTVQTSVGRAGEVLRSYGCFDFSGGLDVVTNPVALANENTGGRRNRLTEAINIVYNVDGSVSKRWGADLLAGPIGNANPEWLGGCTFAQSNGAIYLVSAFASGQIFYITGPATMTGIIGGLTNRTRRYSFATFQDTLYIANGVDPPMQWTGAGGATLLGGGAPATAKQFVAHGNRLFATASAVPSRLYWSKLNNPSDWTGTDDAGFMDVNPNDGAILKALVPSVQELALLKSYRPYRLQGIGPVTGYTVANSLTPAAGSIGAAGPTSAVFAGNDVWYMSQTGVHRLSATDQFGDLTQAVVSDAIEPYFRQHIDYAPYGVRYAPWRESNYQRQGDPEGDLKNSPMAAHDPLNGLLLFGQQSAPTPSAPATASCDRLLAYDLRLKTWAEWQILDAAHGPQEMTCLFNSIHGDLVPEIGIGTVAGLVGALVSLRRGVVSDYSVAREDYVPVTAHVTHLSSLGAVSVRKCPRHLTLYFLPVTSSVTLTVEIFYDLHTTPDVTTSFDLVNILPESPIIKRIDLGQHLCDVMAVRISNTGIGENFRWVGYEVLWSARRAIRR